MRALRTPRAPSPLGLGRTTGEGRARRLGTVLADALLLALPGGLIVYTGFNGGGFFAGTQGALAVLFVVLLVLRVTLSERPFAGAGPALALSAASLSLFAAWALASASWSQSPARALLEFDRALLYLLVLVLFGSLPMTPNRLAWLLRGLTLGVVVVCAVGLVTRLAPDVWPITAGPVAERLSYPITYWNAMGLLGALGVVMCLTLTCDARGPRWSRVVAAGATPICATATYLTLSRGGIAAGIVGVAVLLVIGRPTGVIGGLLAAVPASAVAVRSAYRSDRLNTLDYTDAAGVAQGHETAQVLGACIAVALVVRFALLRLDAHVVTRRPRLRPRTRAAVAALVVTASLGGLVAVGAPGAAARQIEVFVERSSPRPSEDARRRLTDASSNGRIDAWRISLDEFRRDRWLGEGAGTFQIMWNRHRPYDAQQYDAHSLYMETLAEMGIPGMVLLSLALLVLLGAAARRIRGPDRTLFAGVLALLVTWAVGAAVDWNWEMPVVTLWVFALGGATLAVAVRRADGEEEPRRVGPQPGRILRVVIGLGLLVLAVVPARVAVSQERLNRAVAAFSAGRCADTIDASLGSIEAMGIRPEPHQLLAWCNLGFDEPRLALRAAGTAVALDPRNWEYHYTLALVRGVGGLDPLPAARRAAQLNPLEPRAAEAVEAFQTRDPRLWRTRALRSRLPAS